MLLELDAGKAKTESVYPVNVRDLMPVLAESQV
jgi:hypothetical protein